MKTTTTEVEAQIANLKEWFPKGSTVYLIIRSVAKSGMSRTIGVLAALPGSDGEAVDFRHPNYAVSTVLGLRLKTAWHDGVFIQGAGMDMGFELVYRLGMKLYGDGYALKHRWL